MRQNIYICDRKRECNGSEICGTLCRYTTEPKHEDQKKAPDYIMDKNEATGEMLEYFSERKLNEAISKMKELKKEGNSFAECVDECIEILREVIMNECKTKSKEAEEGA